MSCCDLAGAATCSGPGSLDTSPPGIGQDLRRLLVFSPPRNWVTRTLTRLQSVGFRLMGKSFRIFAHPPAALVAISEAAACAATTPIEVRSGRSSASREWRQPVDRAEEPY
jgi:hypothetical protein